MYDHGSSRAGAGNQVGLIRVLALAFRPDWTEAAAYLGTTYAGRQALLTRLAESLDSARQRSDHRAMWAWRPADISRSTAERVS